MELSSNYFVLLIYILLSSTIIKLFTDVYLITLKKKQTFTSLKV